MSGNADHGDFEFYRYDPSTPAAIIFIVVFGLLAISQLFQIIKFRIWFFIPFIIGTLLEVVGYVARTINSLQAPDYALGAYVCTTLTLLLPPIFFAASIYMTFGRLVTAIHGDAHAVLSPRWTTRIFVTGDVFSLLMQGSGGGLLAQGKPDTAATGEHLIVAGLVLQIVYFGFFVIACGIFQYRFERRSQDAMHGTSIPWRRNLFVLYGVSILIFVRSVFRTIEYAQGNDGYLISHEVFLYIFDAVLMTAVVSLYVVFPVKELAASRRKNQGDALSLEETAKDRSQRY